jgi:hypothetical protein
MQTLLESAVELARENPGTITVMAYTTHARARQAWIQMVEKIEAFSLENSMELTFKNGSKVKFVGHDPIFDNPDRLRGFDSVIHEDSRFNSRFNRALKPSFRGAEQGSGNGEMRKPVVTFVLGGDWEGLYVDDQLVTEGHVIPIFTVLEKLKDVGRFDYRELIAKDEVLEEFGSLPQSLAEVRNQGLV